MDTAGAGGDTGDNGGPPRRRIVAPRSDNAVGDFLTFRLFIAPVVIQVLFWLGVLGAILYALFAMYAAVRLAEISFAAALIPLFGSMVILVIGPILVRVYCETIIVFFRIYDVLQEIRDINARK